MVWILDLATLIPLHMTLYYVLIKHYGDPAYLIAATGITLRGEVSRSTVYYYGIALTGYKTGLGADKCREAPSLSVVWTDLLFRVLYASSCSHFTCAVSGFVSTS